MSNIFLCGHTGSDNRGCEAIVRSTVKIFGETGLKSKPYIATYSLAQDKKAGIDKLGTLVEYKGYGSRYSRYFYAGLRKIFKNPIIGQSKVQKAIWEKVERGDLSLAIGGDTYCYKVPTGFVAHNKKMKKMGVPSVLWCCSVGKEYLTNEVKADLDNYTLIVARESYTCENLIAAGIDEKKILRCCDPAFRLDIKECELPEGFKEGNTVGFNFSSLVSSEKVKESAEYLIETILSKTDMNICFIPHVYSINPQMGDIVLLEKLYEKYEASGRVSLVNKELSCEQLKFIISKCRFFIGARTHSTIAAYSTGVPTLVLGYSVKSLGIAKDLFGTDKGYVLPYNEINDKEDIWKAFSLIIDREEQIKEHYARILPEYIQTVQDTADMIYKRFLG